MSLDRVPLAQNQRQPLNRYPPDQEHTSAPRHLADVEELIVPSYHDLVPFPYLGPPPSPPPHPHREARAKRGPAQASGRAAGRCSTCAPSSSSCPRRSQGPRAQDTPTNARASPSTANSEAMSAESASAAHRVVFDVVSGRGCHVVPRKSGWV